ncbi:hypothetical protein SDJN02_25654, partial [Cucurbita argyrosperma subsp. argyrosperma]
LSSASRASRLRDPEAKNLAARDFLQSLFISDLSLFFLGFSEGVLADIEGAQDLAARSSVLLQCWYFVSFYVLFALMFAAGWNRMV